MLKQRSGMCTGTLIGDGLILTARHCATNPAGLPLEHAIFSNDLFAADAPTFGPDGDESPIKCGGYTGTGGGVAQDRELGWEPQWLLIKSTTYPGQWCMFDSMRGLSGSADFLTRLSAQSSDAEYHTFNGSTSP